MSVTEFFHAGGYGFYLWWSFGLCFGLMLLEVLRLKLQRGKLIKRLKRLIRLEQV